LRPPIEKSDISLIQKDHIVRGKTKFLVRIISYKNSNPIFIGKYIKKLTSTKGHRESWEYSGRRITIQFPVIKAKCNLKSVEKKDIKDIKKRTWTSPNAEKGIKYKAKAKNSKFRESNIVTINPVRGIEPRLVVLHNYRYTIKLYRVA
jgi:hypothetical protein